MNFPSTKTLACFKSTHPFSFVIRENSGFEFVFCKTKPRILNFQTITLDLDSHRYAKLLQLVFNIGFSPDGYLRKQRQVFDQTAIWALGRFVRVEPAPMRSVQIPCLVMRMLFSEGRSNSLQKRGC